MTRFQLFSSIANLISGYRVGEIPVPTAAHVERWVRQFPVVIQNPILCELKHVLDHTYVSREFASDFLDTVISAKDLVGDDAPAFWRTVNFLDCQQIGTSQNDMLEFLRVRLEAAHGVNSAECGTPSGPFVYLDDAMFTGGRVGGDLEQWIRNEAPSCTTVHVIVMVIHSLGEYLVKKRLRAAAIEAGKEVEVKFWRSKTVENRKSMKNHSEVLWPIELPEDPGLAAYAGMEQKFPWVPREPGGWQGPFSSERGRQVLEREFLLAGVKIRSNYANPSTSLRPLGFSPFGLGFGSMAVTFRNCPNNAPLALWWGNVDESGHANFDNWYPLLPRRTYQDDDGLFDVLFG